MAEVTRQLGPLEDKIDRATHAVERLYNTNGGPPGYLQTARAEDNGRFEMIFNILEEHKETLKPIENFLITHEVQEKDRERRFNRRIALMGIGVALLTAAIELLSHSSLHRAFADPPSQPTQQQSIIPETR